MITFYCGVNEKRWNHHPVQPGAQVCIAPVYGRSERTRRENRIAIPADCSVIQDSGAFSDSLISRLDFGAALERQMIHAEKYRYAGQITHRASYDLLIDEVWTEGNRYKRRWSEVEAQRAVNETVEAAAYIHHHRQGVKLVQSAQGVTAKQYLACVKRLMPYISEGDLLGLGGWCIIGKMPKVMMPVFRETIELVIPFAARQGINQVHIWGVIYPPALGNLLYMADQYGIAVSTDSAGPSLKPCLGEWGYGEWRDKTYKRVESKVRGLERAKHVAATRQWLAGLRESKWYLPLTFEPYQLSLWAA